MSAQDSGKDFVLTGREADIRAVAEQARDMEALRDGARADIARLAYVESSAVAARARLGGQIVRLVDERIVGLGRPPIELPARTGYFEAAGEVAAMAGLATKEQTQAIGEVMRKVAAIPLCSPVIFLPVTQTNPDTGLPRVASGGLLNGVRATATGGVARIEFTFGRSATERRQNVRRIIDMIPSETSGDSEPVDPMSDMIVGREAIVEWVGKRWAATPDLIARSAVVGSLRGTG